MRIFVLLAALVVALTSLGRRTAAAVGAPEKLTANDTILLAAFADNSGDSTLTDTLEQVLRTALEESPFLNVVPPATIAGALNDMAQPSGVPLSPELARRVCQHTRSRAYASGSIARHGEEYIVGLQATDCESGQTLAQQQSVAQTKERILDAVADAASKVRVQLGETVESVRNFNTPLSRATSDSFDALRAWNAGITAQQERGDAAALPFLESAIRRDPGFATALFRVGQIYRNTEQEGRAREFFAKAFAHRERASARERFRITGLYYAFVTVEYRKAVNAYRRWMQSYPHDEKAVSNLGSFYGDVCEYERSIAQFRRARRMNPDDVIAHEDLIEILTANGQFEQAQDAYRAMQRMKLDDDSPHVFMYSVAFLQHDTDEMAQQAAWFDGKPQFQHEVISEQADAEAYAGHLARARELTSQAVQAALAADNKEQAAAWQLNSAWREDLFENPQEAHQQAVHALTIAPESREGEAIAAILLARTGDIPQARTLAKDLEMRYPVHAVVQSYWLPCIRAQIDLVEKRFASASQELERAKRYDTLFPQVAFYSPMLSVVLRAEAYLGLGRPAAAAKEWQKILQYPGIVQLSATAPIGKLQLARALAAQAGSNTSATRSNASSAYQDFLTLWKDADPEIPILKEAQVEFAKLN